MIKRLFLIVSFLMLVVSVAHSADVYTTKRGKFYHKADCTKIEGKRTAVLDEKQAQARAIRPCPLCILKNK
jgi:hypothetical protein